MANIKVFYFDGRGRGELSRLLLAASGEKWEDVRFSGDDWPKYKPEAPFGQAPFLEYKGKKYAQSVAMANFLAREFGFYGKSNLDALRIDEVCHLVQDLIACEVKYYYYAKDETEKQALLEKLTGEDIPKFFGFFQKLLKESGTGLFVGNQLTMADLAVYDQIINLKEIYKLGEVDEGYLELQELVKRVEQNPNIQKYLEEQKAKAKKA